MILVIHFKKWLILWAKFKNSVFSILMVSNSAFSAGKLELCCFCDEFNKISIKADFSAPIYLVFHFFSFKIIIFRYFPICSYTVFPILFILFSVFIHLKKKKQILHYPFWKRQFLQFPVFKCYYLLNWWGKFRSFISNPLKFSFSLFNIIFSTISLFITNSQNVKIMFSLW